MAASPICARASAKAGGGCSAEFPESLDGGHALGGVGEAGFELVEDLRVVATNSGDGAERCGAHAAIFIIEQNAKACIEWPSLCAKRGCGFGGGGADGGLGIAGGVFEHL